MREPDLKARTARFLLRRFHLQNYDGASTSKVANAHLATFLRSLVFRRILVCCGCICLVGSLAFAQFAVNWHTIDGGGGHSAGGAYTVSGTIGQHDAGLRMAGGNFTVVGGFWALPVAVQSTNGPTLIIAMGRGDTAIISWSPETPGFFLQEAWVLSGGAWSNSPSGDANPAVVPITIPAKFYRLHKP